MSLCCRQMAANCPAAGKYTFARLTMEPLGSEEFSIEELPAELKIRYGRHAGWVERILAPIAVPVLIAAGWFWQKPFPVLVGSGLIMVLTFRWAWGHQSVLRVLPDRLIASSYLQNSAEIALSEIESMKWLRRDALRRHSGPQGLYISYAGRSQCVLPLVSEEQAKAATDAISRKFPKYPVNVPVPGSDYFEAPLDLSAFTLPSQAELDSNEKT
jgi:hypothetical protein